MIRSCTSEAEYEALLAESRQQPVFLLKHSSRCPISAAAHEQFQRYTRDHPEVECRLVLVIEHRPLSQHIASETGIAHASPQALLFSHGQVVWHASHYAITERALAEAYVRATAQ